MGEQVIVLRLAKDSLKLLARAVEAESRRLELEIKAIQKRIKRFEKKYRMSSKEFLSRYTRGELDDREDFMEWYGELMFLEEARREYEELRRIARRVSERISD